MQECVELRSDALLLLRHGTLLRRGFAGLLENLLWLLGGLLRESVARDAASPEADVLVRSLILTVQ